MLLSACPRDRLGDVARATTPAEERAAFVELARAGEVGFSAHDADGQQLDLGSDRWWERARTLRLHAGGGSIEHRLLDPQNVLELMHE